MGQGLRFVQEYFLVACSLADLVRRFRRSNSDWTKLPEKVAIQLNDTHPAMAVPELMRILLDDAHLGWDQAWDITQRTLAYTNHTLLPEALEKWPVAWFEMLLPRHLEIIYEINRRLLDSVRARFPGDEGRVARVSLIEEGPTKHVAHGQPGHRRLAQHQRRGRDSLQTAAHNRRSRTWPSCFPTRFSNKTNGVTPRRWLLLANPALARTITEAIGDGWITDLESIEQTQAARRRQRLSQRLPQGQTRGQSAVCRLAQDDIGPDRGPGHHLRLPDQAHPRIQTAIAQCAADRGALQPAAAEPGTQDGAADIFLRGQGGARLPSRQGHHQVHQQPRRTRSTATRRCRAASRSLFLPEYDVTLAERLIPASDVSNQISTAGYEASGTSNMKFMMNGALTIGTRDGATIEMAEEAGEENFFLFGLTAEQVAEQPGLVQPALAL